MNPAGSPGRSRSRVAGWIFWISLAGLGLGLGLGWSLRLGARRDLASRLRYVDGALYGPQSGLAQLGSNAVPILVEHLTWRRPAVYETVIPWLDAFSGTWGKAIRDGLPRPSSEVQSDAALGLQLLGPEARAAVPHLLRRAQPAATQEARRAIEALLAIAPGDPEVAQWVVRWLADPVTRTGAVRVLAAHRAAVPGVVPGLARFLLETNEMEAAFALRALAWQGPSAETAGWVPEALRWMRNPVVRDQARRFLVAVAPAAGEHRLALLRQVLRQYPPPFELIIALGTNASPAQALVEPFLADPSPLLRAQAAAAQISLGGDLAAAIRHLTGVLQTPVGGADGLIMIPEIDRRLGALARMLDHRQAAAWYLGSAGSRAEAAWPALRAVWGDENRFLALLAAQAALRLRGPDDDLLGVVRDALASPDADLRSWAVVVAGEAGARGRELEPELRRAAALDMRTRRMVLALLESWHREQAPEIPGVP